jgi:hypothetical protein
MLGGMEIFLASTAGASPVLRAAVAAFGFIYLHPLADGNGRIHRFLINDILRRDGAVPGPYILPVSASIMNRPQDRVRYDEILEVFSKPFMRRYGDDCEFTERTERYPDGVISDFRFAGYEDALAVWRYPDLTRHVEYLADLVDVTIQQEMRKEAVLLRAWDTARRSVKEIVEGPDPDIDRIIRSIHGNGGKVSNKLVGEYPVLADLTTAKQVAAAVVEALAETEAISRDG